MTTPAQRLGTWRYLMSHTALPAGVEMDGVSKWLIITRASVFTMTATSGLIGGLLAIGTPGLAVNYWYLALSVIGLVIAHASNNMINDYFDLEGGVDTDEYVRALYAPHPILS
jgi:1,4-dihydroxy-2-naphthoate polyprenyltransferase